MKFYDKHGWEHPSLINAKVANLAYKANAIRRKKDPTCEEDEVTYKNMYRKTKFGKSYIDASFKEVSEDEGDFFCHDDEMEDKEIASEFYDPEEEYSTDKTEGEVITVESSDIIEYTPADDQVKESDNSPQPSEFLSDKNIGDVVKMCIIFRYNKENNTIEVYNYEDDVIADTIPVTDEIRFGILSGRIQDWKSLADTQKAIESLVDCLHEITG